MFSFKCKEALNLGRAIWIQNELHHVKAKPCETWFVEIVGLAIWDEFPVFVHQFNEYRNIKRLSKCLDVAREASCTPSVQLKSRYITGGFNSWFQF